MRVFLFSTDRYIKNLLSVFCSFGLNAFKKYQQNAKKKKPFWNRLVWSLFYNIFSYVYKCHILCLTVIPMENLYYVIALQSPPFVISSSFVRLFIQFYFYFLCKLMKIKRLLPTVFFLLCFSLFFLFNWYAHVVDAYSQVEDCIKSQFFILCSEH